MRKYVKVWCPHPPAMSNGQVIGGTVTKLMIDGRVVSPATPVPVGTTLENITWMRPTVRQTPLAKRSTRRVTGSKGKVYLVTTDEWGRQECTCPGFTYRRNCKHVRKSL